MTIQELYDLVLLRMGQHKFVNNLEISLDDFRSIVNHALSVYSKYKPLRKRFMITITDGRYEFVDDIPDYIVDVTPVGYISADPLFGGSRGVFWEYRKPFLYTNVYGDVEVEALYNHRITNDNIEVNDELFIDLVIAILLMSIGRSRRAFRLPDLPVETDAESLVSEGQELYELTIEKLRESSILL